ncbi:BA75_00088T0 [Komagataella pastoris]|uniref:BA75_00088T0 n=1 Tax=Komagataella pastoris TaxID=4922 RepID=A0A1B2J9C9_PICPA|nr:BA75_00088T0 [Komagataella pastoris]
MGELDSLAYILTAEFDKSKGIVITNQYPCEDDSWLLSSQLQDISNVLMPSQLQHSMNRESITVFPIYSSYGDNDSEAASLSYEPKPNSLPSVILSISYFKSDDSYRNGTANCLSIVTALSFWYAYKNLLIVLLHLYIKDNDFSQLSAVFQTLNKIPLRQMDLYFQNIPTIQKDLLKTIIERQELSHDSEEDSFLSKILNPNILDEDEGEILRGMLMFKDYLEFSPQSKCFKANVLISSVGTQFPIQIPLLSLLSSKFTFFGLNLEQESIIRTFLLDSKSLKLQFYQDNKAFITTKEKDPIDNTAFKSVLPYGVHNTPFLIALINALLQRKRIIVYSYSKSCNELLEFIMAYFIIVENFMSTDSPCTVNHLYPYVDVSQLEILEKLPFYVAGTANIIFQSKPIWDLFINLDDNSILLNFDSFTCNSQVLSRRSNSHKRFLNLKTNPNNFFRRQTSNISTSSSSPFKTRRSSQTSGNSTPSPSISSIKKKADADSLYEIYANSSQQFEENYKFLLPAFKNDDALSRISITETQLDFNKHTSVGSSSSFIAFGFQYEDTSLDEISLFDSRLSQIDSSLLKTIESLLKNNERDSVICDSIFKYLDHLINRCFKSHEMISNSKKIREFTDYIQLKLDDSGESSFNNKNLVISEINKFMQRNKIVQPFVLGVDYGNQFFSVTYPLDTNSFNKTNLLSYYNSLSNSSSRNLFLYEDYLKANSMEDIIRTKLSNYIVGVKEQTYLFDIEYILQNCFFVANENFKDVHSLSFMKGQKQLYQIYKMLNGYISSVDSFDPLLYHCLKTDKTLDLKKQTNEKYIFDTLESTLMIVLFLVPEESNVTGNQDEIQYPLQEEFENYLKNLFNKRTFFTEWFINHSNGFIKSGLRDYFHFHYE